MKVQAVIGANYGDEGKGLYVDKLTHDAIKSGIDPQDIIVIRSNGGAQAGHTVQLPDGRRHTFHHMGSGSLLGARTHLSRYMICNPIVFNQEWRELRSKGVTPRVTIDPQALVSLPVDMMVNQMVEINRGDARHGSCGLGINETIKRSSFNRSRISVSDLQTIDLLRLAEIRDEYLEYLINKTGLGLIIPDAFKDHIHNNDILESFLGDCQKFLKRTDACLDQYIGSEVLIFEAAQGLALDQNNKADFPHLTRSNTGLQNIVRLCDLMKISLNDIFYMTRCYNTRHGAGPLPHEQNISQWFAVDDPTNIPNDWQGSLRFAPLDITGMMSRIHKDLDFVPKAYAANTNLVVTCLDQTAAEEIPLVINDKIAMFDPNISLSGITGLEVIESRGPTRETISYCRNNMWFKLHPKYFKEAAQFFIDNDICPKWANGVYLPKHDLSPETISHIAKGRVVPLFLNFEDQQDFTLMVLAFAGLIGNHHGSEYDIFNVLDL